MCASVNHSLWSTLHPEIRSLRKLKALCCTTIHSKHKADPCKTDKWNTGVFKSSWKVWCYLNKHLANGGASFVGSAIDRHGLPVSGELQSEFLLHQLLDDLRSRSTKYSDIRIAAMTSNTRNHFGNKCGLPQPHNPLGLQPTHNMQVEMSNLPSYKRSPSQPWKGPSVVCQTRSFSPPGKWGRSLWLHPPSRTPLWPDRKKFFRNVWKMLFDK